MTIEMSTPSTMTNPVIVVGMLDTMLVRDRSERRDERRRIEVTRRSGRERGDGGRWERLTL